ncbi:hypothetical protein REPUB_Repub01dG0147700 [Reevesia pubescens]
MMSLHHTSEREHNQVLFEGDLSAKKVTLNRPKKLNILNYEMICQMLTKFQAYEQDSATNLVILKGNGRAFCAGGDAVSIVSAMLIGHWSFGANFYQKQLALDYLLATYKKPLISLINGIVMGGGAGLSVNAKFRVVTENAIFAMPEASIGLFPDVGASYFLSRLPDYFGEYLGLSGARLDGKEMLACGLATHFVLSKDLVLLENELNKVGTSDITKIASQIDRFSHAAAPVKPESAYARLKIINKCFSKNTVEEILFALEKEIEHTAEKWMVEAVKYMKAASPISLKIFLRSIREGREQTIGQCLAREYIILSNILRGSISNDFTEGTRAKLIEKDNKPKVLLTFL